jgi:hypothetical protein
LLPLWGAVKRCKGISKNREAANNPAATTLTATLAWRVETGSVSGAREMAAALPPPDLSAEGGKGGEIRYSVTLNRRRWSNLKARGATG